MYLHARNNLEEMLRKLPGGELMLEAGQKVKAGVKTMVLPGMWFEELGLRYLGPINGHSINDLVTAIKTARAWGGPVLLHVETVKGKGFEKAEAKAGQIKWHAATPADLAPQNGAPAVVKKAPPYTQVFSDALVELAAKDEKIVAITAAMPGGTGIDHFIEKYPMRGFDVGMIEEHAVTFASGLALGGFHPVVAIYSTFLQRSFDQIIHDVCQVRDGLPVTFALDRGGLVGEDGATHQGVFDLSYLRCIPHMTLMAPRDEDQLRHMLKTSTELETPSAIRYPRGNGIGVPLDGPMQTIPIGKGELLLGAEHDELDLSIIAIGYSVNEALAAAKTLTAEGVRVAVFDARFVKPLDETAICELARRSRRLVTVEENVIQGGFGSAVLELLHRHDILLPVRLIGVPDQFIHHGAPKIQRAELGLDAAGILASMRQFLPAQNGSPVNQKVLL
jgi:1-deoxy-D-xylulose-5-phosphate synthase